MRLATHGVLDRRIRVNRGFGNIGAGGLVERVETSLDLGQVTVVEHVGVHLHEQYHSMQYQKHLRGPSPLQHKRNSDPNRQPSNLVRALNQHAALRPGHADAALATLPMQRDDDRGASHHQEISYGQVPQLYGEQRPDLLPEGEARVLVVPQHRRDPHDGQPDPEQVEEPVEVVVVGLGVEVRHARLEVRRREEAPPPLFRPHLLSDLRDRFGGFGGVFGNRGGTAAGMRTNVNNSFFSLHISLPLVPPSALLDVFSYLVIPEAVPSVGGERAPPVM